MEGRAMARGRGAQVRNTGPSQGTLAPLTAIRKRAQKVSNLWIFDSPKNARRLTVSGDVGFMHLILLEGDISLAGYDLIDDPFKIESHDTNGYVRLRYHGGRETWITVGRQRVRTANAKNVLEVDDTLQTKAAEAGVTLQRRSELELAGKEVFLDNWLTLCAMMTRARLYPSYLESERLLAHMAARETTIVSDLLAIPGVDRGIMLAVIARGLQNGWLATDLEQRLFGLHTKVKRVRP
jgi:hypothetical protein